MAQNVTLVRQDGNEPRDVLQVTNQDPAFDLAFDFETSPPQPQQAAPPPPPPPPPPQQFVRPPPPQQQQQQQQFVRPPQAPQPEELNDFANPNKIEDSPMPGDGMGSPEFMQEDEYQYQEDEYEEVMPQPPPAIQPLPPFATLEEERSDLMYKLQRAARSGIQVRTFGWNADIREMRAEVSRAKAEQEVDASIAFQRQIMMTICTGLEYANKRFAYLDLELDGWSESLMDDIGKFDTVFEKLHKKHAGRMNIPPELQLIFMIGGSAMTWHLVAKSRSSRAQPEKKRRREIGSSESDSDTESERSKLRKKYSRPAPKPKPKPKQRQQKEMRGPGFDMGMMGGLGGLGGLGGSMLGGLGGLAGSMLPQVPVPNLAPQLTRFKTPAPKTLKELPSASPSPSPSPSPAPRSPSPEKDDESDRLSDIPSELEEVPSDFGASPQESPKTTTTKMIDIGAEKPKRRGRPRKDDLKKVVVI